MLWTWLGNLIAGPVLGKAVDAYKARLDSGNTSDRIAADLAGRELAVQQREAELQTQYRIASLGRWYEPDKLMGYTVAIYFAKILVWDKVLAFGVTDPLGGFAETTATAIVACYFIKRGFENVARIIRK